MTDTFLGDRSLRTMRLILFCTNGNERKIETANLTRNISGSILICNMHLIASPLFTFVRVKPNQRRPYCFDKCLLPPRATKDLLHVLAVHLRPALAVQDPTPLPPLRRRRPRPLRHRDASLQDLRGVDGAKVQGRAA